MKRVFSYLIVILLLLGCSFPAFAAVAPLKVSDIEVGNADHGIIHRVATIADLRLITGSPGRSAVQVLGSRGGLFAWNSADYSTVVSLDTQGGLYVAPNADPTGAVGCWVRQNVTKINIDWFGAVPDDGLPDQDAVQAAIIMAEAPSGQTRPPLTDSGGVYNFTSGVTVSHKIRIDGTGWLSSVWQADGTFTLLTVSAPYFQVSNLKLTQGSGNVRGFFASRPGGGIELKFDYVTINGFSNDGLYAEDVVNTVFTNVVVNGQYPAQTPGVTTTRTSSGLYFAGNYWGYSTTLSFRNVSITSWLYGLRLENCADVEIADSIFQANFIGIYSYANTLISGYASQDVILEGNWFEQNYHEGYGSGLFDDIDDMGSLTKSTRNVTYTPNNHFWGGEFSNNGRSALRGNYLSRSGFSLDVSRGTAPPEPNPYRFVKYGEIVLNTVPSQGGIIGWIAASSGVNTAVTSWLPLGYAGNQQFILTTSLPGCGASVRGKMLRTEGGAGVADSHYICTKKADDTYAWWDTTAAAFKP
jgi:hypothetical protein